MITPRVPALAASTLLAALSTANADIASTWDGTNGDLWSDAAHWSPSVVPNNDTPPGALYDVTVPAGLIGVDIAPTVSALNVTGGANLSGVSTLTVTTGITFSGSSSATLTSLTLTNASSASSTIGATGPFTLNFAGNAVFNNNGTLTAN